MLTIDLSLKNDALYKGCAIEEVAGRLNLITPAEEAKNVIGRNINEIVESMTRADRKEVLLTGPMAIWSYLIVFHVIVHAFTRVYYSDGRSEPLLVAAHGG